MGQYHSTETLCRSTCDSPGAVSVLVLLTLLFSLCTNLGPLLWLSLWHHLAQPPTGFQFLTLADSLHWT